MALPLATSSVCPRTQCIVLVLHKCGHNVPVNASQKQNFVFGSDSLCIPSVCMSRGGNTGKGFSSKQSFLCWWQGYPHRDSHSTIKYLANVASFIKNVVILCTFTILIIAKSGHFLQSFVAKCLKV